VSNFGEAFYKAVLGSNERLPGLPTEGEVKHAFLSVRESDKKYIADIAKQLIAMVSNLLRQWYLSSTERSWFECEVSIKSLKAVHIL
jgi:hypothetical protein